MKPKVRKQQISEESVEAKPGSRVVEPTDFSSEFRELGKTAIRNAWDQTLAASGETAIEQLLGVAKEAEQDLVEGQELVLTKEIKVEKPQVSTEHITYIRTNIERADATGETKAEYEVRKGIEEIRMEIRKLVKTSKLVERSVKDAAVEKAPVRPGKYHLSFFEFVLSVIKDATRKLEDTVHFGAIFASKKQQSKYWNAYRKHGTMFGLSGERTTATQTG